MIDPLVITFDLDDTLYPEMDFVRSGFESVARYLAPLCGESWPTLYGELLTSLEVDGRGRQFDVLLARRAVANVTVPDLVTRYRAHKPTLQLPGAALSALGDIRAAGHSIFVLTDGDPVVQRTKVEALGLRSVIDGVICTWDEGRSAGKPNPRGFSRLLAETGARPRELVYVADNPVKDFIAVRRAGGRSIRLLAGPYRDVVPAGPQYMPDVTIERLGDVPRALRTLRP
ncbi:MAG: HAD family hydrolase [Solirubrobacteraceae bacterium]